MNLSMAIHTWLTATQTAMRRKMRRRHAMALQADSLSGLIEQALIIGSVRLMAFDTSAAVGVKSGSYRMLMQKGAGIIGMAILTCPVQTAYQNPVFCFAHQMTIGAIYVLRFIWMGRALFELGSNSGVAGNTKLLLLGR